MINKKKKNQEIFNKNENLNSKRNVELKTINIVKEKMHPFKNGYDFKWQLEEITPKYKLNWKIIFLIIGYNNAIIL